MLGRLFLSFFLWPASPSNASKESLRGRAIKKKVERKRKQDYISENYWGASIKFLIFLYSFCAGAPNILWKINPVAGPTQFLCLRTH